MTTPCIGQTVVTDPDTGRSGGYVMVAASPDVQPADAQHLSAAPQVTDYLHLEASPRPCFSFYPLPSGRWALSRRFVRGTRRGAFNRVVAHTLLVPAEVLRAVADEPWLLVTRCRFRTRAGGGELTPAELGERAAVAGSGADAVESLPDLECLPLPDPVEESLALLRRRRDVLRRRWEVDELTARLHAMFAAIAGGGSVLLPQDTDSEQLLAFGWSSLPAEDRFDAPWTTHLAPSAAAIFRYANTPEPEAVRRDQADPERWILPGLLPAPADPGGGSEALARYLVTGGAAADGDALGQLYQGLRRRRAGLAGRSAAIRRWIVWLERGGSAIAEGFEDPARLRELLAELRSSRPRELEDGSAWIGPPDLLGCAAASVLAIHRGGRDLRSAFSAVLAVIEETGWRPHLLTPAVIAELGDGTGKGAPRTLPAEALAAALRLVTLAAPEPPGGSRQREEILRLILGADFESGVTGDAIRVETLAELAVDLGRAGSTRVTAAAQALGRQPRGLDRALDKIGTPKLGDLPFLLAARRAAGAPDLAARIAAERIVPLLLREPDVLADRSDADLLGWGGTVGELAEAAEAAGGAADASKLRARWWLELARRTALEAPRQTLEMLDGIRGDDRAVVARAWRTRAGTPAVGGELLACLATLAEDDPELAFGYALEGLAAELRAGEVSLEAAANHAARLARRSPSGGRGGFRRALQKLLPRDPDRRARAVVELLLSPRLLPSSKRVLDTVFRDSAFDAAGAGLLGALPGVRELAARGSLLLRSAESLGDGWRHDPAGVSGFLREALLLERHDAAAAFLTRAQERPGRRIAGRRNPGGFLEYLGREGDPGLLRRLAAAARPAGSEAVPSWDLRAFAPQLDRLRTAPGRRP